MAQPLEAEPWLPPEDELLLSAKRMALINRLHTATSEWTQIQASTASLGKKAVVAVMLQEAQIQLAAYNDFHAA